MDPKRLFFYSSTDVDECSETDENNDSLNKCSVEGTQGGKSGCKDNVPGSYSCTCKSGYDGQLCDKS